MNDIHSLRRNNQHELRQRETYRYTPSYSNQHMLAASSISVLINLLMPKFISLLNHPMFHHSPARNTSIAFTSHHSHLNIHLSCFPPVFELADTFFRSGQHTSKRLKWGGQETSEEQKGYDHESSKAARGKARGRATEQTNVNSRRPLEKVSIIVP